MSTISKTLLDIYHPEFRRGYYEGRKHYFREQTVLTDKLLVEMLLEIVEESQRESSEQREAQLHYAVGHLIGQLSARLIPLSEDEENAQQRQEAFLNSIIQKYGDVGPDLKKAIEQYWATQDQLAQTLDADGFVQMLSRGRERRRPLVA